MFRRYFKMTRWRYKCNVKTLRSNLHLNKMTARIDTRMQTNMFRFGTYISHSHFPNRGQCNVWLTQFAAAVFWKKNPLSFPASLPRYLNDGCVFTPPCHFLAGTRLSSKQRTKMVRRCLNVQEFKKISHWLEITVACTFHKHKYFGLEFEKNKLKSHRHCQKKYV